MWRAMLMKDREKLSRNLDTSVMAIKREEEVILKLQSCPTFDGFWGSSKYPHQINAVLNRIGTIFGTLESTI